MQSTICTRRNCGVWNDGHLTFSVNAILLMSGDNNHLVTVHVAVL